MAMPNGTPCVTIAASIAATRPTIDPTDRSISPITMTKVMVSAIRPISTEFVRMNEKFRPPREVGRSERKDRDAITSKPKVTASRVPARSPR